MIWEYIQIFLLLYLLERVSIHRKRYKIAIDTNEQFMSEGYWSVWIYRKKPNDEEYWRSGGKRLVYFTKYIIPHVGS
jgi:hypothetical protein